MIIRSGPVLVIIETFHHAQEFELFTLIYKIRIIKSIYEMIEEHLLDYGQ